MKRGLGYIGWSFVIVLVTILSYQLACRPHIGLTDNGDFWRILDSFGMRYPAGYHSDLVTWSRYYDWDGTLLRLKMFPSSEILLAGIALAASRLISKHGIFDVITLGILQGVLYVVGLSLIASATAHWGKLRQVLLCALLIVICADVGYVSWFNSLYTESATLVFFMFTAGTLALISLRKNSDGDSLKLLSLFYMFGFLFVTAKLQNAPMGFVLAGLGYYLSRQIPVWNKGVQCCARRRGAVLSVGMVLLTVAFWGVFKLVPGMRTNNLYNMVFNEILRNSNQPSKDLAELGLNASYMKYHGTNAWSAGVTEDLKKDVLRRVGDGGIIRFFARHPGRFYELAGRGAKSTFLMRVPYLGNFEQGAILTKNLDMAKIDYDIREYVNRGSGYPYVLPTQLQSHSFDLWSGVKDNYVPKCGWFLVLCLATNVGAIALKRTKFDSTPGQLIITAVHVSFLLGALLQFLLVLLGEAEREIVKHLFLFNLLSDACFVLLVVYAAYLLLHISSRRLAASQGD